MKDSYKYHTRLDAVEYIEAGALQHFGENVLAMLIYLASVPTAKELQAIKKARDTLYFTALGGKVLVMLKASHATLGYLGIFLAAVCLASLRIKRDRLAGYITCFFSIPLTMVSGIAAANITAAFMVYILDKPMTYFRREWWCLILYGMPMVLGKRSCFAT